MAYEYKTKPYQHQDDVLKRCWNKVNWAFLMEMGTGKSKVCIDNAAILYEKSEIDTLIVIAPRGFTETGLTKKFRLIFQIGLKELLLFGTPQRLKAINFY